MFVCPNCGGNLKFDIRTQQLGCEHCQTQLDPYTFEDKEKDAIEKTEFDVTIFTCPQCGGEILSTDTSAAEFCTFCGASTILYSRLSKEKRPNYIIPFQITKEDCKNAYSKMMSRAIFAPDALKNPKHIDSFRGIYMPYWAFYMTQDGKFSISGSKSHRKGDYIYTDHYALRGEIDAYYKGLSYDASSSFDDNISTKIAPYDVKSMKAFTPGYLSGFYADTSDVDSNVYKYDAEVTAFNNSIKSVYNAFPTIEIETPTSTSALQTKTKCVDSAMFPVWFMSYRNGDRVSYATVNGQTGKVVADLPVDIKKYLMGSLLLAIPIFIILNLLFTITPPTLLTISTFLMAICIVLCGYELSQLAEKESGANDIGRLAKEQPELLSSATVNSNIKKMKNKSTRSVFLNIYLGFIAFIFILSFLEDLSANLLCLVAGALAIVASIYGFVQKKKLPAEHKLPGLVFSIVAIVISVLISLLNPVNDIFYYSGVILTLVAVFIMIKNLIHYYNILATRRLPQFDRTGGDDHA